MKKFVVCALGALAVAGAGLLATGCKQSPELTKESALAMIQAQYDQQAPVNATVQVNDAGMKAGVVAKYWDRSKAYPNQYWADFKLSDEGKKAIKLPGGGDTIEWHPESATDTNYAITVMPVVANHLKARNPADVQDDMGSKTMQYDEVTSLDGVPDPVQSMARLSSTKISNRKTARFVLDNGAWKLEPSR